MTIKNRRKHARRVLLRNKSLLERLKEAQIAHDIILHRMELEFKKNIMKIDEYKEQKEASI